MSTGRVTAVALLALLTAACAPAAVPEASPTGTVGAEQPVAVASDLLAGNAGTLDGSAFDAAELDSTPVVLWFWAPWCTICRAEAPEVAEVAGELAAAENPVRVLGVPGRGERAAMQEFVAATGTDALTHLFDADGTVWNRVGVITQPAYAFVSPAGQVRVVNGALDADGLRAAATELAESA